MKTKLLVFALLLLSSLSLSAQISGVVSNSSTSSPIANHMVYLQGDSMSGISMSTTTNSSGQYSFTNVGSSYYYDIFTYDCNQNVVSQTKNSLPATANFSICNGSSTSCQASFNSFPDSNNTNMIYFQDNSTGSPTSWSWSFGDGGTSNVQNPSHTYSTGGNYTVTLIISSSTCSDTTSSIVSVGNPASCQASFTSSPSSSNSLLINFTDNSTGNPTSWSWNFGDGNTSNLQNPSHTYSTSGTYSVSLTISGSNCQSNTTQNVVVSGNTTTYSVSGTVLAGSNGLDAGGVQLLNPTTGAVIAQSGLDSSSMYHFTNVAAGNYLVFSIPSPTSTYYTTYAATYYVNSILWSSATTLTVNGNLSGKDINLHQIVPMSGSGGISGTISTGSKGGVTAVVNLLNSSNNPTASTVSDANGHYSFANVADGTYKIWVEIAGKTTTPIIVNINSNNQTSTNNDFVVKGNTVTPKTVSINTIEKGLSIKTYPNPFENNLNIAVSLENNSTMNVELFNLSGQLLLSKRYQLNAGSQTLRLNLNQLAKGTYILKMTDENMTHTQQLITKIK